MRLTPDTHLHSREHLLADDLSQMMLEPKRFAAYLGVAKLYYEDDLRTLAKRVVAKRDLDPKSRGKYFFGALKGLEKKIVWVRKPTKKPRVSRTKKFHAQKTNRTRTE